MNVKLTKGLAAAAVSAAMMLGAAAPALAETAATNYNFDVQYNLTGEGSSLAEDLTFAPTCTNVTDAADGVTKDNAPNIKIENVEFAPGALNSTTSKANADATIVVPTTYTSVGKYFYDVKVGHNTKNAGVTYDDETLKVEVVVENGANPGDFVAKVAYVKSGEKKIDGTDGNGISFDFKTGDLSVSKKVTGNLGDKSKYFDFSVTFTNPKDVMYATSYTIDGGSEGSKNPTSVTLEAGKDTTVTIHAKDGDTVNFQDLPAGVTYKVTEAKADGYTTTESKKADGSITGADKDADEFTNNKESEVDTGVLLNNAPYIAIIGGAAVVAIYVVSKRRHSDMD